MGKTPENFAEWKKSQNENGNHRKLASLITWNTALSNPMKL